jgi:hypothetical protein
VTAARHFDRFAAVPGHDEIVAMAPAAIYSCLTRDDDTAVAIGDELAAMDATPQEVAATFSILAAAMLGEACGGQAEARRLAARWTQKITGREARAVADRNAAMAGEPASPPPAEPAKPVSLRDELKKMGLL